jgi:hypothetical protein
MRWAWALILAAMLGVAGCGYPNFGEPTPVPAYKGPYYIMMCRTGLTWYVDSKALIPFTLKHTRLKSKKYLLLLPSEIVLTNQERKARCARKY